MSAMLPLDLPPAFDLWTHQGDRRDWLEAYRQAETRAELAAETVRAACEAFKAERTQERSAAYAVADRAYDAARLAFQRDTCEIVTGIRAIAGIARHMQLAGATLRML